MVAGALEYTGQSGREVSLVLTNDRDIAQIHGEFLDDPTPTDVITFDIDETVDLVVNVERANRVATERGHDACAELALYIVHGVLHAGGYDDIDDDDRLVMRGAERDVLARLALVVSPVDEE